MFGGILPPQLLVPFSVVDRPKLFFCVVALRVQPFHPSQLLHLPLNLSVLGDKVLGVRQPRAPQADTDEQGRLRTAFVLFFFVKEQAAAARMQTQMLAAASWAPAAAKGTQPERVDAEFLVDPVNGVLCPTRRKDDVLYDVILCHAVFVEAVIEDPGVEEGVQSPAEQADEGDAEVREDVTAGPERATVITEEVVRCGYRLGPSAGRFVQDAADMEVVPGERVP